MEGKTTVITHALRKSGDGIRLVVEKWTITIEQATIPEDYQPFNEGFYIVRSWPHGSRHYEEMGDDRYAPRFAGTGDWAAVFRHPEAFADFCGERIAVHNNVLGVGEYADPEAITSFLNGDVYEVTVMDPEGASHANVYDGDAILCGAIFDFLDALGLHLSVDDLSDEVNIVAI